MRRPSYYRLLNLPEQKLATDVFGETLPPWRQIGIGNGLGFGDAPWTDSGGVYNASIRGLQYEINLGDVASYDLTLKRGTDGILDGNYGAICELFIHEMTHVWQYFNGFSVIPGSIWAHTFGSYSFTAGDYWDSYNSEQQASIVETWHHNGQLENDKLFPYIRYVIRDGGQYELARSIDLDELSKWQQHVEPLPSGTLDLDAVWSLEGLLLDPLKRRYHKNDVAGYGERARWIEEGFRKLSAYHKRQALDRLKTRRRGDKVSEYFYDHLSTALRAKLLHILRAP